MGPEAWLTLLIVVLLFAALVWNVAPPDLMFLAAAAVLAFSRSSRPKRRSPGFPTAACSPSPSCLWSRPDCVKRACSTSWDTMCSVERAPRTGALGRLSAVVIPLSAFLNNTPIVAMFLPVVIDWCRRNRVSPSKLLIPLSYLTILGGTCTLIGTSTNLVVNGLMVESGEPGMSLFEISKIGIPYAIIGVAYIFLFGRRLLPDRKELLEQLGDTRREYLAEMLVQPGCRLVGKTVEQAGLRQLPGLFLIEIDTGDRLIAPVGPDDVLEANSRLVFTGIVSSIIDLERIPGLVSIGDPNYEVTPRQKQGRRLCEAVISESSPLIRKTIREADFRATYGAAVVAVHRGGKRVEKKIGDIRLQSGDTLLLQVGPHFLRVHRHDPAFLLVSEMDDWRPLRRDRAWVALILFVVLIVFMSTGFIQIEIAATLVAVLMIALGCISAGDARRSIEWQVLITIAAAFGVGAAIQNSGLATAVASNLVEATRPLGPLAALAVIYFLGSMITELITNNAAAVLMFPFCLETARLCQVSPRPFLIALVLAASASFMTPIGYQTNMMVYGPGGYRFFDFMRIGAPLHIVLWMVAMVLIPIFWPF